MGVILRGSCEGFPGGLICPGPAAVWGYHGLLMGLVLFSWSKGCG